jgi:hypothetical protein
MFQIAANITFMNGKQIICIDEIKKKSMLVTEVTSFKFIKVVVVVVVV